MKGNKWMKAQLLSLPLCDIPFSPQNTQAQYVTSDWLLKSSESISGVVLTNLLIISKV